MDLKEANKLLEQMDLEITENTQKTVKTIRRKNQIPLDRYFNRGQIDEKMYEAGKQIRFDYYIAEGHPVRAINYDKQPNASFEAISERIAGARERYELAIGSVSHSLQGVVFHVCCMDEPAKTSVTSGSVWSERDGLAGLRFGLADLVKYYKF